MEFLVNREKLSKILSIISHQVLTRPALPVLANVLFEAEKNNLKISATNLELGMIFSLEAKVGKAGKITLPAKTLTDFILTLTAPEVDFKLENSEMAAVAGKSFAKIPTISADEYPLVPKISKVLTEIEGVKLVKTLERVVFAAAVDPGRPILTGVLLSFSGGGAQLVATDGYRLSFEKISVGKSVSSQSLIIPSKTLIQLGRMISEETKPWTKILFDETINQIGFEVGGNYLVSRLIDGTFPDWQKIIPESFKTKVRLAASELSQAVRIASVFAKDSGNTVRFNFGKKLEIKTQSGAGTSLTTVPAEIEGEGLEIAFNWRYLSEILQVIPQDKIEISLVENLSPAKFAPVESVNDFFHIIMPVRIT